MSSPTVLILGMDPGLLTAYVALLVLAIVPIYWGSHLSVDLLSPPPVSDPSARPTRKSDTTGLDKEVLSSSDAYWFPITGSAVLFGLYLLFNYLDKDHVNTLLTVYFALLGCYALASVFADTVAPIERFLGLDNYTLNLTHQAGGSNKDPAQLYAVKFTRLSLVTFVLAALLTAGYVLTKHWLLNNLFAFALSITAIALMDLDSFKTGMTLLAGLFVYDIFWVFGTNVMVSVAKSFDAPVKMIFPKVAAQGLEALFKAKSGFTMLGLGDIVIPGIYVALSLRFDYHNHLATKAAPLVAANKQQRGAGKAAAVLGGLQDVFSASFATPYFTTCFAAYISGLVATVWVMHTFQAAQPALLYLSPACILSTLLTALVRGELGYMFSYSSDVDKELKDDLVAAPSAAPATAAADKKKKNKKAKKPVASSSSSSSDEASDDEDQPILQDRNRARKLAPAAPTTTATAPAPKKKPAKDPSAAAAAAAAKEAADQAERKRKRRDVERFDFEEQAAPPMTKRVHAVSGANGDVADDAASEQQLPSAPRSRASTREAAAAAAASASAGNTSSDDHAPVKKSKASKATKKPAAAAPAPAALVSEVFTEAIAETGVGKTGLSGKPAAPAKKSAPAAVQRARSKSPKPRGGDDVFTTADLQASMAASLVDDEFMVVSRKGKKAGKANKAAAARADASPSPDAFDVDVRASPSPSAGGKKKTTQDLSQVKLPDISDFGF